jgi:hypothetical protein
MNEVNLQNFNAINYCATRKEAFGTLNFLIWVYDGCVECSTSMATIAFEHHLVYVGLFSYKLSLHFTS